MMNLFSIIADQVRTKQELFDDEGKIMQALVNSGYRLQEADAALTLMQTLVQREVDNLIDPERALHSVRIRTMTAEERERFTSDAFGFVLKLALLGIISEEQREDIIEKAMNTFRTRIDLDCIKMLIAFTVFAAPHGEPMANPSPRRIRKTAWN